MRLPRTILVMIIAALMLTLASPAIAHPSSDPPHDQSPSHFSKKQHRLYVKHRRLVRHRREIANRHPELARVLRRSHRHGKAAAASGGTAQPDGFHDLSNLDKCGLQKYSHEWGPDVVVNWYRVVAVEPLIGLPVFSTVKTKAFLTVRKCWNTHNLLQQAWQVKKAFIVYQIPPVGPFDSGWGTFRCLAWPIPGFQQLKWGGLADAYGGFVNGVMLFGPDDGTAGLQCEFKQATLWKTYRYNGGGHWLWLAHGEKPTWTLAFQTDIQNYPDDPPYGYTGHMH